MSLVDSLLYLTFSCSVGTSGTGGGLVGTSSRIGDCGWILAFRDSLFVGEASLVRNKEVDSVDRARGEFEGDRVRRTAPFSLNSVDFARRGTA